MNYDTSRRYPRTLADAFPSDRSSCTEGWRRPNADRPVVIACVIILIIFAICYGVQLWL
jgi:hypothetical protein